MQKPLAPEDRYEAGRDATALHVVRQVSDAGVMSMSDPLQKVGEVWLKAIGACATSIKNAEMMIFMSFT